MLIEPIREGLDRLPVPSPTLPPATHTNAWLLSKELVVDPAAVRPAVQEELVEILSDLPIQKIFLTHHHHDHIGSATLLRKHLNIPICCSKRTAEQLPFSVDILLQEGDMVQLSYENWMVYETPGHAQGHLCLFSPKHLDIIAGDMVAGEGTILLAPPEGNLKDYLQQLKRLQTLEPIRLLPAHGPAIQPAIPYLQEYIDHRLMRTEQLRSVLSRQPQTTMAIAKRIYTELPPAFLPLAAKQMQCHLEYLCVHFQASKQGDGWIASVPPNH
ncbi:MAG: MBL fold metallo-hydrolase [Myxococcota bacterium]|nr:MBL fold metallo-hydrolase [Myxococcota bacterium]